jgi:hypothetical protein
MVAEPGSIDDALSWLKRGFRAESARGVRICYQIVLEGEAGGTLRLDVEDGHLDASKSSAARPDVVFRMQASDFYGVLVGRENPDLLFMDERLCVEGDLSLALKLRKLFGAPA